MKKLFSVLAIAALAACNSGGTKTEEVKPDSTAATVAPAKADTAAKAGVDTAKAKVDTTTKK